MVGVAVKKTKVFLHIGHGKTGTSAVQSSLAIASDDLFSYGINYPIHPSLRDRLAQLEITSGNWSPNPESRLIEELLSLSKNNKTNSKIILSSESLFWETPELIQKKSQWDNHIDLHIIMAVREIEEMLSSEYQQRVKRHGDSMPLEQFIRARKFTSSHHAKAAEIIDLMTHSGISHTIINYSKHKQNISRIIFQSIGAEKLYPESKMNEVIINRSLSQKELEIMLIINKLYYSKLPQISTIISDTLIKNLPNIESQQCRIASQQLEKVYSKNSQFLETINSRLSKNEQLSTYRRELTASKSAEQAKKVFDEEKLSIQLIADTLQKLLALEYKKPLSNETVDAIISLSQSENITKNVEIELLEVAKENRPQGQALTRLISRAKKALKKLRSPL